MVNPIQLVGQSQEPEFRRCVKAVSALGFEVRGSRAKCSSEALIPQFDQSIIRRIPSFTNRVLNTATHAGDFGIRFPLASPADLARAIASPDQVCVAVDQARHNGLTFKVEDRDIVVESVCTVLQQSPLRDDFF